MTGSVEEAVDELMLDGNAIVIMMSPDVTTALLGPVCA
jgi:hypothetical protein